jgi:Tfp pilus assembly protein PilF
MKKSVSFILVILTVVMLLTSLSCSSNNTGLSAQDYNKQGLSLAEQGKYKDAVTAYTNAIKLDSKDAQFYLNRGKAYLNMKEFDLAIADFEQAIKLDPTLAEAYAGRGCAYMNKGELYLSLAILDFNKTIELSKNADLTAYAREMLANLAKNPPFLAVIPLPPVINIPPAPIINNEINNENQQGNVALGADITGNWEGTFEVVNGDDDPTYCLEELTARGEFSFNMVVTQWGHGDFGGEGTGSGTMTGTYHYLNYYDEGEIKGTEKRGNVEATFSVRVTFGHLSNGESDESYIYLKDFTPKEYVVTTTYPPDTHFHLPVKKESYPTEGLSFSSPLKIELKEGTQHPSESMPEITITLKKLASFQNRLIPGLIYTHVRANIPLIS